MDRQTATALLGVPPREISTWDDDTVTTRDGVIYEVPDGPVDHWVRTNPGKTPVRYHAVVAEPEPTDDEEPAVDVDGDGVPDGTANQILEWVGEDPERAKLALAAEQARGASARKSLVSSLEKLAG